MIKNIHNIFHLKSGHLSTKNGFLSTLKLKKKEENIWVKEILNELPNDFYEKRKIGEIIKLIQKDTIGEFITYIEKNSYSVTSEIKPSIYETNNFLLKYDSYKLIEYAAFYGSIQIFNYLRLNGVVLTSTLWLYSIHGQDEEIIHILEEKKY